MPTKIKAIIEPDIEEGSRAAREREGRTQLKRENEALYKEREVMRRQLDLLAHLERSKSVTHKIHASKGYVGSEATAILCFSDLHVEERVDPSTVNNVNEYNLEIARASAGRFFSNGMRMVEICGRDVAIKEIVLAVLGDMITGYIHEDLVEDNYLSPNQATEEATSILRAGIDYIAKHTKARLRVICKHGNHGRTTDKMRISTEYKNSFEWLMYRWLASYYRGSDQVEFIHENGYHTWLDVYDRYPIRFHHGHAIRYKDGVGGITIPVMKAIAKWDIERKAYLDIFAHHHQQALDPPGSKFVSNGSVIGYNSYAVSIRAAFESARQSLVLIDRDRGKTITAPIFVR